jgi:hypothetical protein
MLEAIDAFRQTLNSDWSIASAMDWSQKGNLGSTVQSYAFMRDLRRHNDTSHVSIYVEQSESLPTPEGVTLNGSKFGPLAIPVLQIL